MATISVQFFSQALCGFTDFKVMLPNDIPPMMKEGNPAFNRPTKTLYLLHGFSGTDTDWIYNTQVGLFAGTHNLAIVCPQGGNSFYLDGPETGRKYGTFIGEELVNFVSDTFGLSKAREDVFIGGFSMGGFGALHTAFAYPQQFSKVLSFSAALIHHNVEKMTPDVPDPMANYEYYRMVFGEPALLGQSENNPETLLKKLKAEGKHVPGIFQCIGTEDFLYGDNQLFRSFLTEQGVPFTYREESGMHDFMTVSKFLPEAMRFLMEA